MNIIIKGSFLRILYYQFSLKKTLFRKLDCEIFLRTVDIYEKRDVLFSTQTTQTSKKWMVNIININQ